MLPSVEHPGYRRPGCCVRLLYFFIRARGTRARCHLGVPSRRRAPGARHLRWSPEVVAQYVYIDGVTACTPMRWYAVNLYDSNNTLYNESRRRKRNRPPPRCANIQYMAAGHASRLGHVPRKKRTGGGLLKHHANGQCEPRVGPRAAGHEAATGGVHTPRGSKERRDRRVGTPLRRSTCDAVCLQTTVSPTPPRLRALACNRAAEEPSRATQTRAAGRRLQPWRAQRRVGGSMPGSGRVSRAVCAYVQMHIAGRSLGGVRR